MRALIPYRSHVVRAQHSRAGGGLGLGIGSWSWHVGGFAFCVSITLAAPAAAQPAEPTDDGQIRPPPGTPGSTAAQDPITPPPGTPGSTASQDPVAPPPGTPGSTSVQAPKEPVPSVSEPSAKDSGGDEYDLYIASRTYLRMFQRRYLIGFVDAGPEDETLVPIYEYVSLRAHRIDAPWGRDGIDFRLSGWGLADFGEISDERRVTGDLMDANVTGRFGPAHVTLGRQLTQGGPALVTRFDGVAFGLHDEGGLGIEGYGGLSVRPRFRQRREYVLMGSAAESLLRQPDALPDTSATDGWLAGGRVSYRVPALLDAGASFHERHERGELDRRWASGDVRLTPMDEVLVGGVGTADIDGGHLVEVRGFADVMPLDALTTTAEVLHTNPSLFLSRGSVLSVFSLDTVTEAGGEVAYRLTPAWTVAGSGHVQWFAEDGTGYRLGGRTRARLGSNLVAQVKYSRVTEEDLGYHGLRGSLSMELSKAWTATTALQHYLYDRAIRGVESSSYGSATLEFGQPEDSWRLMLGGFATRSPYATLEAEALARLSIDLDRSQTRDKP